MRETPSKEKYLEEKAKWISYKPPYSSSHIKSCVTSAVILLAYTKNAKMSKYEVENYLRIDISKRGIATFRVQYKVGGKTVTKKLGQYPEMNIHEARERATSIVDGDVSTESVIYAIELYEKDLERKRQNEKLRDRTVQTYLSRTKKLKTYFSDKSVFSEMRIVDIENGLDLIIHNEPCNHANELFAELRRVWKFAASKLSNGDNVASKVSEDYVSSRVESAKPTRLYINLESVSEIYHNLEFATNIQQTNAMRYMILTGVRPQNVVNLEWGWLDSEENPTKIVYPASAMKAKRSFTLPLTEEVRKIILAQRAKRELLGDSANQKFVFLKPTDASKAFPQRSLDKLIKTWSPENCVLGEIDRNGVKGKNGAFNTLCRKFAKSNIIHLLTSSKNQSPKSLAEAIHISQLVLHHKCINNPDSNAEHYQFSEELFSVESRQMHEALLLHEKSILEEVEKIRMRPRLKTAGDRIKERNQIESEQRNHLRAEIKSKLGKGNYRYFLKSTILDSNVLVRDLLLTPDGRNLIKRYLSELSETGVVC